MNLILIWNGIVEFFAFFFGGHLGSARSAFWGAILMLIVTKPETKKQALLSFFGSMLLAIHGTETIAYIISQFVTLPKPTPEGSYFVVAAFGLYAINFLIKYFKIKYLKNGNVLADESGKDT